MPMNINTNMGSLMASAAASAVNKSMETSMERLSTGLRINSAADDAAGVAIADRMTSNIKGLNQAIRNAGDTQGLIDTAEGAQTEITNVLQRMRELAVQSVNDTNSSSDRSAIQAEVNTLRAELDRISSSTTWAGNKLLDGNFTNKQFQIGADAANKISVSVDNMSSGSIGQHRFDSTSYVTVHGTSVSTLTQDATDFDVIGHKGAAEAAFTAGSSAKTVAAAVNADTGSTGVTAQAATHLKMSLDAVPTSTVTFSLNSSTISATVVTNSDLTSLRDAINAVGGTTGVTAVFDGTDTATLLLTDGDGDNISIADFSDTGTATNLDITARNFDNTADVGSAQSLTSIASGADDTVVLGAVRFESIKAFTVADQENSSGDTSTATESYFGAAAGGSSSLSAVSAINLGTQAGASSAISVLDTAIAYVAASRGDLGAISNRLDHTMSNLTNIVTNTEGARSRIADADFAAESTNLAKQQILQQAATSMLAQANASKQSVLSLLQG